MSFEWTNREQDSADFGRQKNGTGGEYVAGLCSECSGEAESGFRCFRDVQPRGLRQLPAQLTSSRQQNFGRHAAGIAAESRQHHIAELWQGAKKHGIGILIGGNSEDQCAIEVLPFGFPQDLADGTHGIGVMCGIEDNGRCACKDFKSQWPLGESESVCDGGG